MFLTKMDGEQGLEGPCSKHTYQSPVSKEYEAMKSRNWIPEGSIITIIQDSIELLELEVRCVGMYFSKLVIRILFVVDHQTRRNKWAVK